MDEPVGFDAAWPSPDPSVTWVHDALHAPGPVAPLVRGYVEASPFAAAMQFVNGYLYTTVGLMPPPPPEVTQRGVVDVWENDYLPKIKQTFERIRGRDYDAMSLAELVAMIPSIQSEMGEAFFPTLMLFGGYIVPSGRLIEFCERELGADGPRLAVTMLQGFENETQTAGARLADLATFAASRPQIAACLREARYGDIDGAAGGAEFQALLASFLEDYGWRAMSFWTQEQPAWVEEPAAVLSLVARYVREPELSPAVSIQRAAQGREAAVREVESALTPDKLPEFQSLLAAAQAHVPVSEGRARWQLMLVGSLRVPILALGRKLVAAGVIREPNDVFYLTPPELADVAGSAGRNLANLVDARKRAQAYWAAQKPPEVLGSQPDRARFDERESAMSRYFVGDRDASVDNNVIRGVAASAGVVRGRARVIIDLSEASRLEAGDILVCRSTAPPWTPLFAIAGGVVTDAGGLLSHSAICAREYAIPCVVATQVATTTILDGATVIVDGSAGTVTVEPG